MFGKFALTLFIAGLVFFMWQRSRQPQKNSSFKANSLRLNQQPTRPNKLRPAPFKLLAMGVLIAMTLSLGAWQFYSWQAGRQLMQITLTNTHNQQEVTFLAFQKNIANTSFVTTSGQLVRLATNERMLVRRAPKTEEP